jgi:putative hydrolase of the HAD superfamily
MILVFDLDDTLYNEMDFIKSGFNAVSNYLSNTYGLPSTSVDMFTFFNEDGRSQIFNKTLKKYNIFSVDKLRKCVSIYRYHKPNIEIYDSAKRCIQRFLSWTKYIVTDGNKLVQANKVNALNIKQFFKHIYITRNYGIDKEKPSPYCFKKIQAKENVQAKNIVYIGDNSNKDFINLKKIGIRTIRIKQGFYKDVFLTRDHEAEYIISSFDELNEQFFLQMDKTCLKI